MAIRDALPYVRIQKIEFTNFRNIEHGNIDFPNSKPLVYLEGAPSILGLYGQNGSGKTSVIMALGILKEVLSGNPVGNNFLSCVKEGFDRCSLSFTFSAFTRLVDEKEQPVFPNNVSNCFELFYDFDIVKRNEVTIDDIGETKREVKLVVENEVLKYRTISPDGKSSRKIVLIDARNSVGGNTFAAFRSKTLHDAYTVKGKDKDEYRLIKAVAQESGRSFLFSQKLRERMFKIANKLFDDNLDNIKRYINLKELENENDLHKKREDFQSKLLANDDETISAAAYYYLNFTPTILETLALFGNTYLQIVDTTTTGLTNINTKLPLLIWQHTPGKSVYSQKFTLNMDKPTYVLEKYYYKIAEVIGYVSNVLNRLVPDMKLSLTDLGKRINEETKEEHGFELISNRSGHSIPLRYESDGIRRMISVLSLLIAVYNEESFTIAIDEIDSGIFEYLLGELLSVMSESMKGQFVFTAHNLRPLEVLPAKYLCFTTPNKDQRFTTIGKRGNSNLRDTYFRSIVLGTNSESVYNPTDKYEIELALYQAGHPEENEQ